MVSTKTSTLVAAALSAATAAHASRANVDYVNQQAIDLVQHGFQAPLSSERVGSGKEWFAGGSTVVTTKHSVVLNTETQNRNGMLFHSEPLRSADFEATVDFTTKNKLLPGQGFGFWFVKENVAQSVADQRIYKDFEKKEEGFDRIHKLYDIHGDNFGMRARHEGAGVVFAESNGVPVVYCIDEKRDMKPTSAKYINFADQDFSMHFAFRNKNVRVRLNRAGQWESVCSFQVSGVTDEGFIGFSSYTGKHPTNPRQFAAIVGIKGLNIVNHDEKRMGDAWDTKKYNELNEVMNQEYTGDMTRDDQTKQIQRLNKMLEQYMTAQKDRKILGQLGGLADRTRDLEASILHFKQEVRLVLGAKDGRASLDMLKGDLRGLRSMIHQDSAHHHSKVDEAREKAVKMMTGSGKGVSPVLDKLHQSREALEDVVKGTNGLFYMFLFIIGAVASVAVAVMKKMQNYEKTHFL